MQKCLFLDRDGVINKDIGYVYKPEDIEFIPGIFQLCQAFQKNGYIIIIVTNQSGIARGFYSEDNLHKLNNWLQQIFNQQHITITDILHCPHHPDITGPCECRKPEPGMLLTAIKKYRIAPQFSMMIGDKESDMIAASKAGIPTRVLLLEDQKKQTSLATLQVSSLIEIINTLNTKH